MWISKKKWKALEQRVADLEKEIRSQPEKIARHVADINKRMSNSSPKHHY